MRPYMGTLYERLMEHVVVAESGCHEWMGPRNKAGYGKFQLQGASLLTHRLAWEMEVGPIPEGLTIDHLCRNRCCLRIDHLEVVTGLVNILRSDGPSARNARKTHCKRGHEFTIENTIKSVSRNGRPARTCRTCRADVRHAKKAKAA